jgi:hypothetical protein
MTRREPPLTKQTYEVTITASALKTLRVRAGSAREAMDTAIARIEPGIRYQIRGWSIDFPGGGDEHYSVSLGDERLGPDACGEFRDEETAEDEDY